MTHETKIKEVIHTLIEAAMISENDKMRLHDMLSGQSIKLTANPSTMADAVLSVMTEKPLNLPATKTELSNYSRVFRQLFKMPKVDRLDVLKRVGLAEVKNAQGKGFNYHKVDIECSHVSEEVENLCLSLKAGLAIYPIEFPATASTLLNWSSVFRQVVQLPRAERRDIFDRAGLVEVELLDGCIYYRSEALEF